MTFGRFPNEDPRLLLMGFYFFQFLISICRISWGDLVPHRTEVVIVAMIDESMVFAF